jgi:hypothetical protein
MSEWRLNRHYRTLTVARLRENSRSDRVEVMFLESARFYQLFRTHVDFENCLARLRSAAKSQHTVTIGLASLDSDIIEDVT